MVNQSRFQTSKPTEAWMGSETYESVVDPIRAAPLTAVLVGFGAGLAVGCLVARGLTQALLPRQMSTAERLGKSVMDALGGVLPDAVSKRLHI